MVAQAVHDRTEIRLVTEFRGAAGRLWDAPSGEVVISGGAGTGKTRAILEWIHKRCSEEKLNVAILRKTLESLKASALVTFQEQVLYDFDGKRSAYDGVTYFGGNNIRPAQFTYDDTGSTIVIGGMDKVAKVLSTERDIIYVNEVTELTLPEWEQLTGRVDRPRLGVTRVPSLVIGDCNPDTPTHWINRRSEEGKLDLWLSTHRDNPAMWDSVAGRWTASGERYLDRLSRLTGVRRLRLLEGKWVAAEGQVYEAWDPAVHLVDRFEIPPEWPRYWWIDFGYVNPFVWLWAAEAPDGDLYIYREIYMTSRLVTDHAAQGLALSAGEPRPVSVVTDHDAEDRATFERDAKVTTRAAQKTVSPGIQAVAVRLGTGDRPARLHILRDSLVERDRSRVEQGKPCSVVEEFPGYVWNTAQGRTKGEDPLKRDDHGMDAVRYGVVDIDGLGDIGEIEIGPAALTDAMARLMAVR